MTMKCGGNIMKLIIAIVNKDDAIPYLFLMELF